ncbi:C-GCAxxG-C-C family protein [Thermodesulfobacteriota bacterium]
MDEKTIHKTIYGQFQSGLHCAEAVSKTVLEIFSDEPHPEVIRSASGFGGGIGGSMDELCGAFTGGVLALGFLTGRENPGGSLKECGELINEYKTRFLEQFGSLNCGAIKKSMSDQAECAKLTAESAVILAELLNHSGLETHEDPGIVVIQSDQKSKTEQCPFSAHHR